MLKFYHCKHCGNVAVLLWNQGVPLYCCGEEMHAVSPKETETGSEKHLPVIEQEANRVTVRVGQVPHPMTAEHSIVWVILQTEQGFYLRHLRPDTAPKAEFCLNVGEYPVAAYAFCNLHEIWKTNQERK